MDERAAGLTPSQTVGPFLHLALADPDARYAAGAGEPGAVTISGAVRDGNGDPVPDAVIETWQIDGRFARCPTDADGGWEVRTVKPPSAPTRDGTAQAPHLVVSVFARGLLDRVVTRLYFGDEPAANDEDAVLRSLPEPARRTLVAEPAADGYRLDVRLQGEGETVFFRV